MDIQTKTEIELKALIYDEMVKVEVATKNIKVLNKELAVRQTPPIEPVKSE